MDYTDILIRPVVTEKSNELSEKLNRYTFIVNRKANKIQIKNAVKTFYGVEVDKVKTLNIAGKDRSKFTNKGYAPGQTSSYKKAIVTLTEGETIDFYSNI